LIELGPRLFGSADHVELISFTIESNVGHLHVGGSGKPSLSGPYNESLGNLELSLEAEFVLAILEIGADFALRLRSGLVNNNGFSSINFTVSGVSLDDSA